MKNINFKEALYITRRCDLLRPKFIGILAVYYGLTVLNALMDGVGMVLLVNLISGNLALNGSNTFMLIIDKVLKYFGQTTGFKTVLLLTIILLVLRVFLYFAVWGFDSVSTAFIRRRVQERGFASLLCGDWEKLRNIRVGQRVGAMTEEAVITTKYITSFTRLIYYLIATIALVGVAFTVSTELTFVMIVMGMPILLLLRFFFAKQSRLSADQTRARQNYTADIAERLATLFQIKVEGNNDHYIRDGLKSQAEMTRAEIHLGIWHAMINAFTVFIPAIALIVFYFWTVWKGQPVASALYLMAGVGVVGARAMAQVNGLIASWGNMSRLSGSVLPVHQLFTVLQEPKRKPVKEKLICVKLDRASYNYDGGVKISNVSATIEKKKPLLIHGPSGCGKTTIANLMAGVLRPINGKVYYVGESESHYDANEYRAKVGYVTQDIHLFHGTIRDNLKASKADISDETLWECLVNVGAADFVRSMGGMDAVIAEAGRSLSGGEKRRLGIARVLASKPDFVIFDEVTAGLDAENRDVIRKAILNVSKQVIVSIIAHEDTFNDIETCMDMS